MKMHWTVENETLHYLKYLTRQGEPPSIPLLYALDVLAVDGGNSQIVEREVGIETRSSLTSLGALDWLPLQQTVPQVSRHVLNVTISTLRFLLQHGAAANESVYHLSLQNMVWDLQKVQSDLKSLFGLNDLQMERLLNYSVELKEIPTHSFLERMICSILSNTSEDEAESKGYQADCHPKWSAVKNYIIHAVSWLKLYGQVFDQWQRGGLLQNLLTGASHGLAALQDQFDEGSEAWKVLEVSHTALLILSDSWAAAGPRDSHLRPQIFEHLDKLQRAVSDLSPCPSLKRLPLLDPVLRNVVAQDLRFVQGVLSYLETSERDFIPGGPDSWRLEKDMFFWGLKQLLTKDAAATCLSGHLSQEAALPTGNSSIWRSLWGVLCRSPSFNETSVLSQLLLAVKDAGRHLQDVIAGHTDGSISEPNRHLEDWKALGAQLSEVNLTCSQVFKPPGAAASPENGISPGGCEYQLVSTVISHILEEGQMSLQEMLYWKVFSGIIGKTCELARYVNMHGSFQSSPPDLWGMIGKESSYKSSGANILAVTEPRIGSAYHISFLPLAQSRENGSFSENSPCQTQNMDWKAVIDNYFMFFNNVVTSPITSTARVLNFTKHLLVADKKLHTLENGPMNVLLSFVEFLEELFLSDPSGSFTAPEFHDLSLLPELVLNRSVLWRNHLESLQRDPHDGDAQKLLEFDKLVTEKIQSLKDHWMRRESKNILRFIKLILFEMKPELREFWLNGISQEERAKFEISSTLGNFSVPEYEKIFSKSFNFSQLFHSDWPKSPAVDADFIHLSRIIIHGLSELSFLTQEQVSVALDTIYVLQNASGLFSPLSEHQKQELSNILTHINIFKDRDAALLLQTYSSFYQYFHKFLNIQKRESLIIYLTQIFRHILDLTKQFNIQHISKALLLLSETTEALGMIPEVSHCQRLLSVLNLLEVQARSLLSTEGPAPGVIRASLTGLKQLFVADEGFRVSLLQYVNQFFNDSAGTLLPSECFILENAAISSVNYAGNEGASLPFPWTQLFSNLTVNGSVSSEFTAIHCTLSWIRTWTEIWGTLSQILKLDLNIFPSLSVGIIQLLDELENGGNISQNCQGIVPTYHTARLILNLFKNVTQDNGFHDWEGLLDLRDLWVALDNELAVVQSLNLAQAEGSFVAMETSLRQLKTFPMKTNASREFLSSLLDVFIELSKASDYVARNTDLINNFLSNDLTDPGGRFASGITELRETILFLRNASQDRGLLSCADIFQSVTELISESNLLPVNASKKPAHILAMLSSIFSLKNASSSLDGCLAWIDVINRLCMMYNSSSLPGHLHSALGSFKDMENKMNSALKILTWVLNRKIPICPLNESNINCVNIYLKDVTEFLDIIVTPGLEKEKVAKFETLLALFNNSTKLVNMIIANLTEDLEFASQFDWKHFRDLLLGPTGMSGGIPDHFQNIWQHSIALGKEMQKLFKAIIHSVLGSSSSSNAERVFSVFSVSPKERDISHLHSSVHRLANYLALNLTHYLQNSSEVVPHEIMKAVDLGIQLMRDVFNSLMPAVHFSIPENSDPAQVLKKVASLMHSLKKADTELLVGQLGEISENLMSFFKNLSRTGVDHLGVNMVVGLVDKLVASSHSWSVNHLLRLSRLLPQEVVTAVLDVYYALPHMAGLLQRVTDKNITESLRDIYNFTLLHGITMFNTTKEDFADAIKTLLDTVELVSDEPAVISKALMCLPRVWCSNHTTSRLEESPKVEGCNIQGHMSPSLYHMVTSILDLLHLPRPSDSECINENPGEEITRKVVCVMHDFADWNLILSELLEIFHVKNVPGKTLQGLWHKVLPFMSPSGNQGNDSISELCPSGTVKQGALQIIKNLKHANFTKFKLLEDMLNKLGSLDKILNITQGTETSAQDNNVSLNLGRIFKLISALWSLRNSTHHLLSPITNFLNANHTDRSPDSSGLIKNDEATHSFEDLWFHFKQNTMDPRNNLSLGQLLSDINRKIQGIALQNTTVQLPQLLEILDSSPLTMSEITEGFLFLIKHWLHDYENEDYFRLVQRLLNAMASGNSTDVPVLARDLTTYLGYLRNSTGEGDFDVGVLTHMLNQEQLADFATVQSLLESIVMNLVSNFAEHSQESTLNFSGTDLHIRDFISLILNHTQSKNAEGFLKQLLETLFSSLLNGMPENKISLLLKDLHRDFMAEMRDKILEILKLDPFLTWLNEDTLMNIVSSFRTVYHLIKDSFSFDNRELSGVLKNSPHAHPREPVVNTDTEDHLDFFTVVTQFLSQVNNSVGLSKLSQNLRSVLRLVRESYVAMANIKNILFHSPALTCHSSSPMLQHTVLAKLTELFAVVNSSFALRNRETLESTLRLFGAISRVGAESHVLEAALEISRTLAMLVDSTAELGGLASSVDSMVRLLNLAKKVSRKMATILGELSMSNGNRFSKSATGQNVTSAKEGGTKEETMAIPHGYEPMSYFQKFLKALFALIEHWQRVPQADQSVFEMCQVFRQLEKPSEAVEMLHRVERMALRVLIIFAENPSLTKDILCAMLSCRGAGMRSLILPAMQGVTLLHHHYQEMGKIGFSSDQLDCERLSRSLSSALEGLKSSLQDASSQGCTCRQPLVGTVQQHMHRLIKSLKETWMTKIPVLMFLSNFTVTEDVKVKDLMKNLSRLTEDLRSSFHISDETIQSILEATISHSKLLSSVLTVALSGKCDEESLHLLLTFPNNEKSWFATRELCSLPGTQVFSLLVMMGQNLNLRNFVYKTLIPSEANGLLNSLLDVISSLSSILTRAQHALEQLPEFLHKFKITALLDMPDFQQLYQEILQSPNGALVWSFLKPILHGKILYTPNSPAINEVIQKSLDVCGCPSFCVEIQFYQLMFMAMKWEHETNQPTVMSPIANYTFYFVDKIKILSETLLKLSRLFQGSGNGQMFNQLQDALRNKFIRSFVESHLDIDVDKLTEDLQTYGQTLDQMFNHDGAGHFQFLGGILANLSSCVVLDRFQAVETVGALETTAHELMQQNSFLASVIFNSSLGHRHIRSAHRKLPPHVTYTIRTNVLYSMRTDLIKYPSWKFHPQNLPADGFKYNYIFVPLQDIIERAIIAVQTGQEAVEPMTQAQAAPYPCHTSDLFLNNVGFFFPLIMMLTWMVSVASMVRKLVYEREIQIEEYMRMMGLHPAIHFLSWFLENMATLALSSAALAVILKMSGIFMHSDAFIIFLFLLDFGVSAVMLSYFLSVFFNQANTAALCTSLGYMISFLPYVVLLVLHNQLSFTIQSLLCLLSTTAFGQGVFFITFLEGQEEGIQWSHMYRAPEPGGMTFGWVCWMILFDSILYFLCGWYFSNLVSDLPFSLSLSIIPRGGAENDDQLFFLYNPVDGAPGGFSLAYAMTSHTMCPANVLALTMRVSFRSACICPFCIYGDPAISVLSCAEFFSVVLVIFTSTKIHKDASVGLIHLCGLELAERDYINMTAISLEQEAETGEELNKEEDAMVSGSSQQNGPGELEGGTPGVALISVTKEYEGHKVAVQELTLTFHRDQITALLGTNGAGKTTIISMLMGLYPPSSGTIIINGKNLQTDLSKVREELGVCPQQDVLLDNLTVREHLMLFAAIKAPWWAKKERQQQVDKTLHEVELTQHQHKPARVLSGGMKRKLSIAIAFMGRSKTVVLDEPSSGVDPCSRRSLWDILLKYRKGRTIIFTTHHLDEAEMLSDHVAVLQQGKLRCYAPPAGLKETYGQGLTLTLTKQPSVLETQEPKDVARVTSLIQVYIPQAFLKDSSGGELTYTIPKDADKSCFKGLCQALDQNLQHLHLTGYGISDTTLEEGSGRERFNEFTALCLFKGTRLRMLLTEVQEESGRAECELDAGQSVRVFLMLLQDTNKKSHITPVTNLDPQNEIPAGPSPQHGASPVRTPPVWALSEPIGGFQLLLGQAVALLRKRLLHTLRAWKSTTSDLLLPVLFVALAMGLFMVQPLAITYPPLKLTPGHYGTAETYFFSSENHGMDLAHVLLRKFGEKDPLCADGQLLGGWSFGVQIPNEDKEVKTNASEQRTLAKVWYNQKGFHSLPSYLNHLNNLILWQYLSPDTSDWRQYGITFLTRFTMREKEPEIRRLSVGRYWADVVIGYWELVPANLTFISVTVNKGMVRVLLGMADTGGKSTIPETALQRNVCLSLVSLHEVSLSECRTERCIMQISRIQPTTLVITNQRGSPSFHRITLKCSYQLPLGPRHCGSLPRRFKVCHDLIRFDYHKSQPIEILGGRFGEMLVESGITLYSHPYGGALLNEDKILESIRQCGVALCIVLGFSILSASIGSSVVRDRVTGAKRLQHISGLGYRTYWLVNFLYDMGGNEAATAFPILFQRVESRLPVNSFHFPGELGGHSPPAGTFRVCDEKHGCRIMNLQNIYNVLKWVFTIFPQFCLGQGLIELCYNQIKYDLTHNFGIDSYVSPFEMNFLGWIFVELTLQGTVLLLLRILVHGDLLRWPRVHSAPQDMVKSAKDVDVEKEQTRVLEGKTGGDILVLCNLSKSYRSVFRRKTTAVHDLSLAIPRGECFGLLGVNGAGKSTTFKILTGEIPPSSGYAVVRTPQGMVSVPSTLSVCITSKPAFSAGQAPHHMTYRDFPTHNLVELGAVLLLPVQ
ncbi:hypothetical protein ACRRTK_014516 [Alexandromys fortis]